MSACPWRCVTQNGLRPARNADHLESAAYDFDGHRVKSIEHLDQAIHEAEICENMK